MLFTYCSLDDTEKRVEEATARIREELDLFVVTEPRRWTGFLARMTRARALVASNSVEGINVSDDDAIAAIDREDPTNTDRATWLAVIGYREADGLYTPTSSKSDLQDHGGCPLGRPFHDLSIRNEGKPGPVSPWMGRG